MAKFTRQPQRNESKIAGMYDLEERLGSGHFAEVKLARHVFTGERVAVKVIDKLKLDETARHHLCQEVRCMKLVQHPNIVRLYEVIDTNTKLYLVQELGDGGDMYDYIMKHESGLSEEKARRYFRQILQAIDYCHRLYVVHRDLKPENVIFFKKFDVAKLTDFGFSNKFMPGKKLQTSCGSLAYSAPEILLGDSYDAPAVDVWSLGVILYMMVAGKPPFFETNESETLTMILDCKFHIPDHVSPACKSLISRMIVRDAHERATLEDILDDSWVHGDHGPVDVTLAPLANQVKLDGDHHNEIVEKMQRGDIADRETIKTCLESGSYNHVSATYYLLAEQILRRIRWRRTISSSSIRRNESDTVVKSHVVKLQSLPPQMPKTPLSDEGGDLDLALVEDLPMIAGNKVEEPADIDMSFVSSKIRYHSNESIYDELKCDNKQHNEEEIVGAVSVSMTTNQRKAFQKKRVAKVKSTPAFLNQISEERESDLDDSPRGSPRFRRSSRRPLDVLKSQQKTRRPSPASSSGGRRSSSHSSSSEDDGDLDKKMRRLSTERCRRSPKRRSDDEGDGDEGNSGRTRSHGGVARKRMMSERQHRNKETSSESGNSSSEQGKTSMLHSKLLQDKLLNVYVKLNEDNTAMTICCGQNHIPEGISDCSTSIDACPKNVPDQPKQLFQNGIGDSKTGLEKCENVHVEFPEDIKANSENVLEVRISKDNVVAKSSDNTKSENIFMNCENATSPEDCSRNLENQANNVECVSNNAQVEVKLCGQSLLQRKKVNEPRIVDSGTWDLEQRDKSSEDSEDNKTLEAEQDQNEGNRMTEIMEAFKDRNFTDSETSDKENMDIITDDRRKINNSCKVLLHGNDLEEIKMYMKSKENGLEVDSVHTIFTNPKVARVTSNCCHII